MTRQELFNLTQHQREDLAVAFADHILIYHSSIREVASDFGVGKSTVHNYLTKYLPNDYPHKKIIFEILKENADNRGRISRSIQTNMKVSCSDFWK